MHDCPGCRVPLHGYEEVCPSCGMKQVVRKRKQVSSFNPVIPGINWMPIVLSIVGVFIVLLLALPTSWIGRLAKEGAPQADPLEKMTYQEARNIVEQELMNGLAAVGGSPKLTWGDLAAAANPAPGASPPDKTLDMPLNLTVEVTLADPNTRKPVMDKVKDYLEKARIPTVTMVDSKSHARWTYNMVPAAVRPEE
jgi:hypothetical protein